jgi:hypothetical protein
MAVRLSVIMVHTPPVGSAHQDLSETVVGELIGLAGIDLTLVGPIATLSDASTDRLTLDSISGDVAMLDWQPPRESLTALSAIGFVGRRTPHAHDPPSASNGQALPTENGGRRIYAFDLTQFAQAGEVVAALTQLRDHRQVRTLSIGVASSPIRPTATTGAMPGPPPLPIQPRKPSATRADDALESDPKPLSGSLDLDQLLDELDQLDP